MKPGKINRPWTDEELGILHRLHREGASRKFIARALDRSVDSVDYKRKQLDIRGPRSGPSEPSVKFHAYLPDSLHEKLGDLAQKYGTSKIEMVRRLIREAQ